jgi:hypothetical protein
LAYQPPASSTFLSEQTSHQQPTSSTFLSKQTSISHQPNEQAPYSKSSSMTCKLLTTFTSRLLRPVPFSSSTITTSLFGWLVVMAGAVFVLREKYCWLFDGGWFVLR